MLDTKHYEVNAGARYSQVHAVLVCGAPVIPLVDTILVGLGEGRVVVQSRNGNRELAHGVEGGGARVDEFLNELGESSTSSPFGGEALDLLGSGDFTGEEKPEETFGKGFGSSRGLREQLLAIRDRLASEPDTLICSTTSKIDQLE